VSRILFLTRPSSAVLVRPPNEQRFFFKSPSSVSRHLVCVSGWGFQADGPSAEYSQMWRPSREHGFPLNLPLPHGHEEVKEIWARFLSQGEYYPQKYVIRHAIDTNQVEGIFWLFPEVRSRPSVGSRSQTGIVGVRLCSSGCGQRLHHAERIRCYRCWSLRLDQERHSRNRFG
jgi:hypothetical protein